MDEWRIVIAKHEVPKQSLEKAQVSGDRVQGKISNIENNFSVFSVKNSESSVVKK